ncbi:MAG: rubrerythrin family protein [Thermoplasmata archaeon]|nr:rubrerythrin family protein [Thermoplasmata archaeon]
MHKMTERNLNEAYAGESMAYMKYNIWADKAESEGKKGVAKLFRAIAAAEKVHATNHWKVLGNVQDSAANLQHAIDGENYEIDEMYPAFKAVAEHQAEKGATRTMHFALETEKIHTNMYQKALDSVNAGKDAEIGDIYVCPVCGFTMEGTVPDYCPVCNAKKESFKKF